MPGHPGRDGDDGVEHAHRVGADDAVPHRLVVVGDRRNPGVGHGDVDVAEPVVRLRDQGLESGRPI